MRFAGIDIGSKTHVVAIVDQTQCVLVKPTPFGEDAAGYARLLEILGPSEDILVAMEATGHYGKNLFATLTLRGFKVALLNPLRTRRFAEEDLARAKTDSIDALGIARFAAQKRPAVTPPFDPAVEALRGLVWLQERLVQDHSDRLRQLHRLVDLCFPEFTCHVRTLKSQIATAILRQYSTAEAFEASALPSLATLRYDGHHTVGHKLAARLVEAARISVARHHGPAFRAQVQYICEDLETLRQKRREVEHDIERILHDHPIGSLLTTIDGIGPPTAARIIAAVGNPAHFRRAATFASYVGVVPGTKMSGLHRPNRAPLSPLGNARLRAALWMPTLSSVRRNPWLRAYYQRLRAAGKPAKVALVAAMRKLLTAVYSVAKSGRPFVPQLPDKHTNGETT